MTRDTVAGESARCSANDFKLTDCAEVFPRGGEDATVFARIMGCFVSVVWHTEVGQASGEVRWVCDLQVELKPRDVPPSNLQTRH